MTLQPFPLRLLVGALIALQIASINQTCVRCQRYNIPNNGRTFASPAHRRPITNQLPARLGPSTGRSLYTDNSIAASNTSVVEESATVARKSPGTKCNPRSVVLARHMLAHELNHINQFNSIWFNDLDEDEILDRQKQSLGNIVMSGGGSQLLNNDGLPLIEIESSYFRLLDLNNIPPVQSDENSTLFNRLLQLKLSHRNNNLGNQLRSNLRPISINLMRFYANQRCYMVDNDNKFVLIFGVTIGPIEHLMDVVYNIPNKLRLSQPIEWHRAQVRVIVPEVSYEIVLHQSSAYKLNSNRCPIQVANVTFTAQPNLKTNLISKLSSSGSSSSRPTPVMISASGLVINNQTVMHLERLFDDYTRPTITSRLHKMLEFYLNSKYLPLRV